MLEAVKKRVAIVGNARDPRPGIRARAKDGWEIWGLNAIYPCMARRGQWARRFNLHMFEHLKRDWAYGVRFEVENMKARPKVPLYVLDSMAARRRLEDAAEREDLPGRAPDGEQPAAIPRRELGLARRLRGVSRRGRDHACTGSTSRSTAAGRADQRAGVPGVLDRLRRGQGHQGRPLRLRPHVPVPPGPEPHGLRLRRRGGGRGARASRGSIRGRSGGSR
jgi:hypothetical protein